MLTRRPAPKILSRDQNTCALVSRLMQHELRILFSICPKAPVVENKLTKSSLLDPLQKLLGDDLVRIHIDAIQRRHPPPMCCKWFHAAGFSKTFVILEARMLLRAEGT